MSRISRIRQDKARNPPDRPRRQPINPRSRPARALTPEPEVSRRLIGRAYRSHQGWIFDPSRRWRGGRRELLGEGLSGLEEGDYCIAEVPAEGPAFLIEVLGADDRPEWDDRVVASQFRLRTRWCGGH